MCKPSSSTTRALPAGPRALLGAGLALLAPACGDPGLTDWGAPPVITADKVVEIQDLSFIPETVVIDAGQLVGWLNRDTVDHQLAQDSGAVAGRIQSGRLGWQTQGQVIIPFPDAGSYYYTCAIHPEMKGVVHVLAE